MLEVLSGLLLFSLGGLFLVAAYIFLKKEWRIGCYFSVAVAALFLIVAIPPTRAFMRTTVWAAFVTTLETTGQGLVRLHSSIDSLREGIDAERVKSDQQMKELEATQNETRAMQQALKAAQTQIEAQEKKLSDLSSLIKSVYEAPQTTFLDTSKDSPQLVILAHQPAKASVYVLLPKPPIPQTLQIQWELAVQPPNSYWILGSNLVVLRWADSVDRLRSKPISVRFVGDPTSEPQFHGLERRGDRVYVDGEPVMWGFAEDDPVLKRFPAGQQITPEAFKKAVLEQAASAK